SYVETIMCIRVELRKTWDQCSEALAPASQLTLAARQGDRCAIASTALFQRNVFPRRRADVLAARTDQAVVFRLLHHVCRPADHAAGDEKGCVQVYLQAQVLVEPRAGPIEIGREFLFEADNPLDGVGDLFQRAVAGRAGQFGAEFAQDCGPRIAVLINAMP